MPWGQKRQPYPIDEALQLVKAAGRAGFGVTVVTSKCPVGFMQFLPPHFCFSIFDIFYIIVSYILGRKCTQQSYGRGQLQDPDQILTRASCRRPTGTNTPNIHGSN